MFAPNNYTIVSANRTSVQRTISSAVMSHGEELHPENMMDITNLVTLVKSMNVEQHYFQDRKCPGERDSKS